MQTTPLRSTTHMPIIRWFHSRRRLVAARLVLAVKCQVCDVFPRFVLGCRNQLFLIKVWQHLFTLNYVWFTEELLIDITRMHHMRTSEIEQKVRICFFFGWPDGLSRQQKSTGLLMRKWHEHNDITLTRDPFVS